MRGREWVGVAAPVLALACLVTPASAAAQVPERWGANGLRQEYQSPLDARPQVRIAGLLPGASLPVGRPYVLTAQATDDVGVAQVRFSVDFRTVGIDGTPPYQVIYTPTTPDRAELFTAEATDTAGQTAEYSLAVRIPAEPVPGEDRPPRIVLDVPKDKQTIPTRGLKLEARAADDRGVAYVRFLSGARTICDDRTAPYACTFRPEASEVGRISTITAVAVDAAGQTQGVIRDSRVQRYKPLAATLLVNRGARQGRSFRLRVRGRVKLPDAITVERGCTGGKMRVRARRGSRTVAIIAPILDHTCRYDGTLSIPTRGAVRLSASFQGNALVGTINAPSRRARAG